MASSRKRRWMVTSAYILAVAAASLLPSGPGVLGGWDSRISPRIQDAGHVPAYSLMLIALVWAGSAWANHAFGVRHLLGTALACCALGLLLELAQMFVPGRTCSMADALANLIGVAAGVVAVCLWQLVRRLGCAQPPPAGSPAPGSGIQIVQDGQSK